MLDGVGAVEGGVEHLVDDVVAGGDEGDGEEGEDEGVDEVEIESAGSTLRGTMTPGRTKRFLMEWSSRAMARWARSRSPKGTLVRSLWDIGRGLRGVW